MSPSQAVSRPRSATRYVAGLTTFRFQDIRFPLERDWFDPAWTDSRRRRVPDSPPDAGTMLPRTLVPVARGDAPGGIVGRWSRTGSPASPDHPARLLAPD